MRYAPVLRSRILLLALFASFLGLRLVHLLADPPQNLDWSLGLFFDEGIYNHNARNLLLFGQWKLDEWNDFYYSALSTWLKYGVFWLIGVGRAQIRLFSIAFSLLSLLFAYLTAKASYGKRTGLLAVLFLGANYIYLMFNRLGMQDTQPVAVFLIACYCWQKGMHEVCHAAERKGLGYFFLAGVVFFISYTFKNLILYLLPTPFVALLIYIILQYLDNVDFQKEPTPALPRWGIINYQLSIANCQLIPLRGGAGGGHSTLARSAQNTLRPKLLKAFGALNAGAFLAFLIWYLAFYLPNQAYITQFGKFFTHQQMFPQIELAHFAANLYHTPFFEYFAYNPVILLGALLFLLVISYRLCTAARGRLHPTDLLLAAWFWAAFAFLGIIAYRPTRYFLPIIPPLCLLAARFISLLAGTARPLTVARKPHWAFFPLAALWLTMILYRYLLPWAYLHYQPAIADPFDRFNAWELAASLGGAIVLTVLLGYFLQRGRGLPLPRHFARSSVVLLLAASLWTDGKAYYQWARTPEYVVQQVGADIMRRVGRDGYIGGMDAPGVAYDTPYKTLISWERYVNYAENPITKYRLTHLFLGNNGNIREDRYYFRKYPREMRKATLLQQYAIKDATFALFSLVEPRLENLAVPKTTFAPGESFQAHIRLRNHDFRQPRRLELNWALYPAAAPPDAKPVSLGPAMPVELPPEQAQEFTLTGRLPAEPGQYRLLVSWQPAQTQRCEVAGMQRQIGQIIPDRAASNQRAAQHDPAAAPGAGFLVFGQYQDEQPGAYETVFRLKIQDQAAPAPVLRIEAAADTGKTVLQQRELRGTDFAAAGQYQYFSLSYLLSSYTRQVEYRVFVYGKTAVWADAIQATSREGVWHNTPITVRK